MASARLPKMLRLLIYTFSIVALIKSQTSYKDCYCLKFSYCDRNRFVLPGIIKPEGPLPKKGPDCNAKEREICCKFKEPDCYCVPEYKCDDDYYLLDYTFNANDPIPKTGFQNCDARKREICCKLRPGDSIQKLIREAGMRKAISSADYKGRFCYCLKRNQCDLHKYVLNIKDVVITTRGKPLGSQCENPEEVCCTF